MTILSNKLAADTWAEGWLTGIPDVVNRNVMPRIKKVFSKCWLNGWMSEWMSEQMSKLPLPLFESLLQRCLRCFKPKAPTEVLNHLNWYSRRRSRARDWFPTQRYQFMILPWTQEGGLQYLWSIFAGLDSKAPIIYSIWSPTLEVQQNQVLTC